jgi:hypothetical protein
MKILAIEKERPGSQADMLQVRLKPEALRLWELYQKGIIREAYFQAERHEAVLMLECKDVMEAQTVIRTLPLVEAGLIDFTLIPLIPYDGFARLFTSPPVLDNYKD